MKIILAFFLIVISSSSFAQKKIYQWRPPDAIFAVRDDMTLGDTVYINVIDRSIKPKKIVSNTDFEEISEYISSAVSHSFPNTQFILPDSTYLKGSGTLIKITVMTYHAGFGTEISAGIGSMGGSLGTMVFPRGKWNAVTSFRCEIEQYGSKVGEVFANISSKDNLWGYSTSRRALEESYNSTMNEVLMFIESNIEN